MTRQFLATVALVLFCTGCADRSPSPPLDHGWAPPGACVFVGNQSDRHYCATTGTQILANPSVYDGQLVRLSGWLVAGDGDGVGLFLTKDSLDAADIQGSVSLRGPETKSIADNARQANFQSSPISARVCGRFHLYGLAPDGTRAKQQGANENSRFGLIDEVGCGP